MSVMDTIAKIRRAHFVQREADQGDFSRPACVAEGCAKSYPFGWTEFRYERETRPFPIIGPSRERLGPLLLENDGKVSREPLRLCSFAKSCRVWDTRSSCALPSSRQ